MSILPQRLDYIHYTRGAAALAVVLTHTSQMLVWPQGSFGDALCSALVNTSTLFVFMSGYLFQHSSNEVRLSSYARSRFLGSVLPYLIISIPALFIYLVVGKAHPWLPPSFFEQSLLKVVGTLLLTGQHLGPLWFMPMIFIFFAAAPAFRWIDRRPYVYWLIAPLLVVSFFVPRAPYDALPLQAFIHFLPVYLLGMAASRWKAVLNPILAQRAILLGALAAGCLLFTALSPAVSFAATLHLKLPLCFALLAVWLRRPDWRPKWLAYIGDTAFGIYLVHGYLIGAGRALQTAHPELLHAGFIQLVLSYIVVTALSALLVEGIRLAAGRHSKIILGVAPSKLRLRATQRVQDKSAEAHAPATSRSDTRAPAP